MERPDEPQDVPSAEPRPDPPGAGPEGAPENYPGPIRFLLLFGLAPAVMALGWWLKSADLLMLPALLEFFIVCVLSAELVALRRGWEAAGLIIAGVLFSGFLFIEGIVLGFKFMSFSLF